MDKTRWIKVEEIFAKASKLRAEERIAFIKTSCDGDAGLETLVLELLKADETPHSFLDAVFEIPPDLTGFPPGNLSSENQIGPYKLIRELGRGGMGVVYLVERSDGEFQKQMALKLVKRGMDTDEILQRFRHERQILASLEHPNIARLYDGGAADDGRPYLVMEYIEGDEITTYCDHQNLSIDSRLKLFRSVCQSVLYAHQHSIIHRDLKPSNIIISREGEPRLLDFGIAKLLENPEQSESLRTRPLLRLGTSAYASPEQLKGDPVTTASDIYSLGMILYVLLTGSHPFRDHKSSDNFESQSGIPRVESPLKRIAITPDQTIFMQRGTTRTSLYRKLKGDLETIVMTAIHPDTRLRYHSAEQLLQDLNNYFDDRPLAARPGSTTYRLRKFVRRNRTVSLSAIIIFLMTVLFVAFTWMQRSETLRERDIARSERDKAQEVVAFLEELFSASDPTFGTQRADTLRIRDLLAGNTEKTRGELAGQPAIQAQMLNLLGNVHRKLGLYDQALPLLVEGLSTRLSLYDKAHPDVAESKNDLGQLYVMQGDYDEAEPLLREALQLRRNYHQSSHQDIVKSLTALANLVHLTGHYDEAEALYREALVMNRDLYGDAHYKTAISMVNLASILQRKGKMEEAEMYYLDSLEICETSLGESHPLTANTYNNYSLFLIEKGRFEEAKPLLQKALSLRKRIYGELHPEVLTSLNNMATLLSDLQKFKEAEEVHLESLELRIRIHGEQSMEVAVAKNNLADVLDKTGKLERAIILSREALATANQAVGSSHPAVGILSGNLASKLLKQGDTAEAERIYRNALSILSQTLPLDHPSTARVKVGLGNCLVEYAHYEKAESLILEGYKTLRDKGADLKSARESLTNLYSSWNKPDKALLYRQ